jgi:hypothetical protein
MRGDVKLWRKAEICTGKLGSQCWKELGVMMMIYWRSGVLVVLVLLISGCGGSGEPTARVEGAVSIGGEPVQQGMISFTPKESGAGMPATADILNGRYQASGVPMGRVLVQIHATKETGKMLTDEAEGGQYAEAVDIVPEKYRSGIEITISGREDSHDFDLTLR